VARQRLHAVCAIHHRLSLTVHDTLDRPCVPDSQMT
jgi:hypothetical protein